jgi:bifunctional enzyme Fae/Hps
MTNDQFLSKLNPKKRYLQIALNSTLEEARNIIEHLPLSERILVEARTPLIKRYGEEGIRRIREWYDQRILTQPLTPLVASQTPTPSLSSIFKLAMKEFQTKGERQAGVRETEFTPYVVADLKMMDRGETEVEIAWRAGASAAVALGAAPTESLNVFIERCNQLGLDAMIDMMNVEFPLAVLRKLKQLPQVVILHRGVDEERFNKEKQIPLHEIRRIKGNYAMMIAIAGGDTLREVQRSIFNDADIVVVWKSFYQASVDTALLAEQFLKKIK